ncbi:FecCD family ABC transporter permease [Yunchengibacter salinarum]
MARARAMPSAPRMNRVGALMAHAARRHRLGFRALVLVLGVAFLSALTIGAMDLSVSAILSDMAYRLGLPGAALDGAREAVFYQIRLPRAVLTLMTGAVLGVAGATLQGLFRNPLADPGLIGISSGAALAAALVIVAGSWLPALPPAIMPFLLPLAAFGGGLGATILVMRLARVGRAIDVGTLLLGGVALNAVAGAGLGLAMYASTDQQLRDLTFWMLGSTAGADWSALALALPFLGLPLLLLPGLARGLNALAMGETGARHLGHPVDRLKRRAVVLVALGVGAAVSLTGVIGFVGLVVPHIVRLLITADHRFLLPGAALMGAALLLLADGLARTLVLPAELPIGVITSAVGGPFFFWLLLRRKARGAAS